VRSASECSVLTLSCIAYAYHCNHSGFIQVQCVPDLMSNLPKQLLLAFNADGMHIFGVTKKELLQQYSYADVHSWRGTRRQVTCLLHTFLVATITSLQELRLLSSMLVSAYVRCIFAIAADSELIVATLWKRHVACVVATTACNTNTTTVVATHFQVSLTIWDQDTDSVFELALKTQQAQDMAAIILDHINAIMNNNGKN
jgi:hypothetical protein